MAIRTITRRELIKNSLASVTALAASPVIAESRLMDTLYMYADFGCGHCKEAYEMIYPNLSALAERNLVFVFRPILPARVSGDGINPEPIVRFFYAAQRMLKTGEKERLILTLFNGMADRAALDSFDSVYQWAMLQGMRLDYELLKNHYEIYGSRLAFEDAVDSFNRRDGVYVPMFIGERNGEMIREWRWTGTARSTVAPLQTYLQRFF
ncbi:MAG: hypothetical protein IBX55_15680 [Methyloprofundus sp.]|nr:hypothetical protein [Methyloprofundus sp.]